MFSVVKPILIEPGTKYFLRETLKNCSKKKLFFNTVVLNITLFFIFSTILGTFLYYRHKTRLTPKERKEKLKREQEYIMVKLKNFNEEAQRKQNLLITNLPRFEKGLPNNYKKMHEKYYKI